MVFVLKKPHGKSPGVIIFKHHEKRFFQSPFSSKLVDWLNSRYLVGMYFGGYTPNQGDIKGVDFFLSSPGTMEQTASSKTPRIFLNAFNFIPEYFCPDPQFPKVWDLICIASNSRAKRVDQFLKAFSDALKLRPQTTALLITQYDTDEDPRTHYTELTDDIAGLFKDQQREHLTVLRLKREETIFSIPPKMLVHFYRLSKVFVLFSDVEGAARVVSEALMCGLPVVTKRSLRGGTRHFLDQNNSMTIENLDDAGKVLVAAIEQSELLRPDPEDTIENFSETKSTEKLVRELEKLFLDRKWSFEGRMDLEDLKEKIPSHACVLPSTYCEPKSDTIKSGSALLRFARDLLGYTPASGEFLRALTLDCGDWMRTGLRRAVPFWLVNLVRERRGYYVRKT